VCVARELEGGRNALGAVEESEYLRRQSCSTAVVGTLPSGQEGGRNAVGTVPGDGAKRGGHNARGHGSG
jgi:hypothetical protein